MKSSLYGCVPVDTRTERHKVTAAELFEHHLIVFRAVVEEYARLKGLSPVVASVIDPDRIGQSYRLTDININHIVDIEHATTRALENYPHLQPVWFALALGQDADTKLSRETITRCGRIYTVRKLAPWYYNRSNRYPEKRGER